MSKHNWTRDWELFEEELNDEVEQEKHDHLKKKKTWEQIQKEKKKAEEKKVWQKKRRVSNNEGTKK
ncbi:hypothetical protein HOE22_07340 [Candidatus Woesearchaeota archaeon]|jgi:hypothetical protein|nr:hypothetical protein [Candidatus Woesearchaeota archaeon]MBT4731728.1 hypothetical protein [Candidatus Woesearchaeota archaeon]MBT7557145.1 hypothetical protein [Candidatus Woesearchaeota archaeon]